MPDSFELQERSFNVKTGTLTLLWQKLIQVGLICCRVAHVSGHISFGLRSPYCGRRSHLTRKSILLYSSVFLVRFVL